MTKDSENDHPFPNKELALIMKYNQTAQIPIEEVAIISNLIHKYCNLRAAYFYGDKDE